MTQPQQRAAAGEQQAARPVGLVERLRAALMRPAGEVSPRGRAVWMAAALACPLAFALIVISHAFEDAYVVQDDARLHVFWMQRFRDPGLFPNDLIADYFASNAPVGFTALYRLAAFVGVDPLLFSKLLPIPLALLATACCFGLALRILPAYPAAFLAAYLLNVVLWSKDDLPSATPRAFFVPLMLVFAYYLVRRSVVGTALAAGLQGLFYPHAALVSLGVLALWPWRWRRGLPRPPGDRRALLLPVAGCAMALLVVVPFAFRSSAYGPTVTADEARALPEFQKGGRNAFFDADPVQYWLVNGRGALLPSEIRAPLLWPAFLLPLVIAQSAHFPLARRVAAGARPLPQLLLASVGVFFVAHLLLFRLHFPSRYTGHTFRIVLVLASAVVVAVLLDALLRWATRAGGSAAGGRALAAGGTLALVATILAGQFIFLALSDRSSWAAGYRPGKEPELYAFLRQQPKDSLVASLSHAADTVPIFGQRPVLTGLHFAVAFHRGYYGQIRQRTMDLLEAQYSHDPASVRRFIRAYGIDYWLLDYDWRHGDYFDNSRWIRQFQPALGKAISALRGGAPLALADAQGRCAVLETKTTTLLDARCVRQTLGEGGTSAPATP